jgi:hypothetical protein
MLVHTVSLFFSLLVFNYMERTQAGTAGRALYPRGVSRFRQTGVQKAKTRMSGDPIIIIGNFLFL